MDADMTFAATRRALHGVAELLLAGPQHVVSGKITLRPRPAGFGTTHAPDLRVEGTAVVAGERRAEIDGRTARELGDELGVEPHGLADVYGDGSGVGLDDRLHVDRRATERIARAYELGDQALRALATDRTPTLWPEHFDLGITIGEVNYGVSPGDRSLPMPYLYVGPWSPPPPDDFWNEPFGAARDLPGTVEEVIAFFEEGRVRLKH